VAPNFILKIFELFYFPLPLFVTERRQEVFFSKASAINLFTAVTHPFAAKARLFSQADS